MARYFPGFFDSDMTSTVRGARHKRLAASRLADTIELLPEASWGDFEVQTRWNPERNSDEELMGSFSLDIRDGGEFTEITPLSVESPDDPDVMRDTFDFRARRGNALQSMLIRPRAANFFLDDIRIGDMPQ